MSGSDPGSKVGSSFWKLGPGSDFGVECRPGLDPRSFVGVASRFRCRSRVPNWLSDLVFRSAIISLKTIFYSLIKNKIYFLEKKFVHQLNTIK